MISEKILHADLLDIIFDGRNKSYGAYALRKGYNARLYYAMSAAMGFGILITLVHFFYHPEKNILSFDPSLHKDQVIIELMPEPKHEEIKVEKPKPKKPVATIQYSSIAMTREDADSFPTIDDLNKEDALISTVTRIGELPVEIGGPVAPEGDREGTGEVEIAEPAPSILSKAEFMPEFPGGKQALYRFLSRNLRVPEDHLQSGEKVRIVVRFVVDLDGSITGITFLEGGKPVFEQEVMRVMKKMPVWKPGMQNGKSVQVYYNIPVIFQVAPNY